MTDPIRRPRKKNRHPDSQEPGHVSREQGLRAWASALAATLPPLTPSQAAAVARIAARIDARRDGQKPAALRSPRRLAHRRGVSLSRLRLGLADADTVHDLVQIGAAPASVSGLHH